MEFISFKEYRLQVLASLKHAIIDYARKYNIYIEVYKLDYECFIAAYSINGLMECEFINLKNIKLKDDSSIIRELDDITYEIVKKAGYLFDIRFEEILKFNFKNTSFWFSVDRTKLIESDLIKI